MSREKVEKDIYNNFTLKAIRVNNGWNIAEAAELIGISKETLSKYEHGKSFPTVPIIRRIEKVYNIIILTDTVNFLEKC